MLIDCDNMVITVEGVGINGGAIYGYRAGVEKPILLAAYKHSDMAIKVYSSLKEYLIKHKDFISVKDIENFQLKPLSFE